MGFGEDGPGVQSLVGVALGTCLHLSPGSSLNSDQHQPSKSCSPSFSVPHFRLITDDDPSFCVVFNTRNEYVLISKSLFREFLLDGEIGQSSFVFIRRLGLSKSSLISFNNR